MNLETPTKYAEQVLRPCTLATNKPLSDQGPRGHNIRWLQNYYVLRVVRELKNMGAEAETRASEVETHSGICVGR